MANNNSVQDAAWYASNGGVTKAHMKMIAGKLNNLCQEGDWKWPVLVAEGYDVVTEFLKKELDIHYSPQQVKDAVDLLHSRHMIFTKLKSRYGVEWNMSENKLDAKPELWEELIKEDHRNAWYKEGGEPLWDDLACIFDNWAYWQGGDQSEQSDKAFYGLEENDSLDSDDPYWKTIQPDYVVPDSWLQAQLDACEADHWRTMVVKDSEDEDESPEEAQSPNKVKNSPNETGTTSP